jgi:hypothetical protein
MRTKTLRTAPTLEPTTRSCLNVSFPAAWPTALPGCPGRGRPEVISPVLASSATVTGLFSLPGAHEVRRVGSPAASRLRAGFR